MESFLAKHSPHIEGTLSCFDRGSFKGYLPLEWPEARESLLARRGLRIMDFKSLVTNQPSEFKVFRQGKRNGVEGRHWLPLRKSVVNMDRDAEIGRATNGRYLKALSETVDVAAAHSPRRPSSKGQNLMATTLHDHHELYPTTSLAGSPFQKHARTKRTCFGQRLKSVSSTIHSSRRFISSPAAVPSICRSGPRRRTSPRR